MQRIHSVALAAGFVAAVGVAAAAAQTPPPEPQKPTPQTMSAALNPDTDFAQKAAMGGTHEVDGAKFASGKATNAELKEFTSRLIKDHTAAGNELSTLMRNKKIPMPSNGMKKDEPEPWRSMTGAAFDRAYVDHLIQEHEKSIANYETEANSGKDAELKAFAAKTLPTIKEHLKLVQDLRKKLGTT